MIGLFTEDEYSWGWGTGMEAREEWRWFEIVIMETERIVLSLPESTEAQLRWVTMNL
jgi:hypothetical protein